jgi:cellulose biosynthesis protein BcsQ
MGTVAALSRASDHVARDHEATMRVLMLATQKGGAGKTTLAAALAVAAQADGERVLAVDLDPQGSLWSWRQRRSDATPETVRGDAADLPVLLEAARLRSATLAVVDTPGLFGAAVTGQEVDLWPHWLE